MTVALQGSSQPPAPDAPAAPQPPGTPATQPGGGDFRVRVSDDGGVTIDQVGPTGELTGVPFDPANMIPPQVPEIIFLSFAGLIGLIMAFPIGRAIARWIDRRNVAAPVSEDVSRRLAAIEQAVDAVAIEVERMSEANRFTTKLLTERVAAPDFAVPARAAAPVHAPAPHDPLSRPPSDRRS